MAADDEGRLAEQSRVWSAKPTLRTIYTDYHKQLVSACPPGRLLDIGGGSAHLKLSHPDIVSLDILSFKGIDVVADAHRLPFGPGSFSGIVMLDVLHHLQRPVAFLREAAGVLQVGGRLAMIEPGMSSLSRVFYDRFHHESVDMTADAFAEDHVQSGSDPWDSNQAIPTLMFIGTAGQRRLSVAVPNLRLVSATWLSLWAYPLSGGFKSWCVMPNWLVKPVLSLESRLLGSLGHRLGFRLLVVMERTA